MHEVPTDLRTSIGAQSHIIGLDRRIGATLLVFGAALLLTATALSASFLDGRLAAPMTHDDVNWFVYGIQHLTLLRNKGFFALGAKFLHESLHAPISVYQATFAYLIFGITDWAPYASNFVWVLFLFGFAAYLLRDGPLILLAAALACLIAMPLTSGAITEFAPEIVCSLFTAAGANLMVRMPVLQMSLRARAPAAACFSLAFLAHPTASPFTLIALLASAGLAFLRDIAWRGKFRQLGRGMGSALLNVLLSLCLPALYMVPRYPDYANYFYNALFDPVMRGVWYSEMAVPQHVRFYLSGPGGQFMFDHKLWAFAAIICLGFVATWWHKDRELRVIQAELLVLGLIFWLVPTVAEAKQFLFASAFGFLLAFMTVVALRSIYEAIRGRSGAIVVSALGTFMIVLYQPVSMSIPNLPQTAVDREFAFSAIDRFNADLLGNAATGHGTKVYMTNMGGYAPNMLQYYMLKTNPTLDWVFDTKWQEADYHRHLDFIHASRQDFVIAGQRGNGLTYSPFAWPAEDAAFSALLHDPAYMVVDRLYGPGGREVAVFQRRGNFAGWHPISGIIGPSDRPDAPREIRQGLAYLQTYAPQQREANLEIEWIGTTPGQLINVFVNHQEVAKSVFGNSGQPSSVNQKIQLVHGNNDIILKSAAALTVRSVSVVPHVMETD